MTTTLGFKDLIDKPSWRPIANAPNASAAGICLCSDMRNSEDRHHQLYQLVSNAILNSYHVKNDGWSFAINPALAGTFGAGAGCVIAPARGPRGTLAGGSTTTKVVISTALPAAVGSNMLAGRGDGRGYKIRIIGNAGGSSGKTEERLIIANTSGTAPTIVLDSALTFTPIAGDAYEILSGRVYLLGAGALAAGQWKAYDIATNSMTGNLATTNLPATISTDFSAVCMDELYVPADKNPGDGYFGALVATGSAATTLTGTVAGADSAVLANEFRNFQIRIVTDTAIPTAVGQRRKITSHTAGVSPVYTVPAWTVTPSTAATFVIENANEILLWSSASANTHCYVSDAVTGGQAADTWSTATYAVRPAVMAAGCSSIHASGVALSLYGSPNDPDKNHRYSFIYSFRGGAVTTLDLFDIAGAATGTWTGAITYGSGPASLSTGTSIVYDPCSNLGRFAYLNILGLQPMYRFNVYARQLNEWAFLRFGQGAALVGGHMAQSVFVDGATKVAMIYHNRHTNVEMFECLVSR